MFLNRLTRFLILVNIIPVKIKNKISFEFNFCSWRTLLNLFFCFGTSFFLVGYNFEFELNDQMEVYSLVVFALINFLIYPTMPSLIGYSLSKMECVLFESPKNSSTMYLLSLFSLLCFVLASVLQAFDWKFFEVSKIIPFIMELFWHASPFIYLNISSFCLLSWIAALNGVICRESNSLTPNVCKINKCCNIYENFNKSFGTLLFVLFSTSSFLTIVNIFFVISALVQGVLSDQMLACVGMSLSAVGHLIFMLSIVLGCDEVHNNLLTLVDVLDTLEETLEEKAVKVKAKNLGRKILNTKPMSGLGFFNIDKNSFVGMLSFAATYIVILAQFRTS